MKGFGTSFDYQGSPGVGGYLNSGGGPSAVSKIVGGSITETLSSALNLFVTGGNVGAMIHALKNQGALRELAEPNLIAMDGQTASFLAGGEFPVPVLQGGGGGGGAAAISVEFKAYGVRLNFKPTIIDEDHIRLELEPEVSTIDFANGVKLNGFVIPALRTRRAKTGIELRDGQSFALAGLLENSESRSLSKVPVIGDVPILGALFRSKEFQKNETELIFFVTAQLVKPVSPDDLPRTRGLDGLKNGSPLGVEPKGEGISGKSGFSFDNGTPQTNPTRKPQVPDAAPKPASTPAALPSASGSDVSLVVMPANPALAFQGGGSAQLKFDVGPPPQR
jgi:pilus assembly protein CpaC